MKEKKDLDIDELIGRMRIPSDEELEAAGRSFDKRLRRSVIRRRFIVGMSSAAAIFVMAFMAFEFMSERNLTVVTETTYMADLNSSIEVPTLILSNGDSLRLQDENSIKSLENTGVKVSADNNAGDDSVYSGKVEYNKLVVPKGYIYSLALSDGTKVCLNAGSTLKYPVEFSGDTRNVELSGEAFFNVVKSETPFEVNVDGSMIRVYGTQFNVKEVSGKVIEAVLVEGEIGFKSPEREEIKVVPGEMVAYDLQSGNVNVQTVDVQYATAWMDGKFKFKDKALNVILRDISIWYGVEFESDINLSEIELTMSLSNKTPIDEVVSFMELMTNYKFIKTERGNYRIENMK